ncbi:MAG: response regulator [Steroidobacteraceae bacterium]
MSNTRALIVDDSRSARHILGRMLESFGLEVDAVESAELALTYLQTARPDVIFMDHLMSGMDGFAAVRVIKANPDTATIPVLMYTSQEGEMYLSQARALGAMGVLPKTLKPADVAEALQHLNLQTPASANAMRPATASRTVPAAGVAERETPQRDSIIPAEKPPLVEVQMESPPQLSVPQLAHRIAAEVQTEIARIFPAEPGAGRRWRNWALLASALVLVLLVVVIYQQYQMQQQLWQLQTVQQQLSNRMTRPVVPEPASATRAPMSAPAPAVSISPMATEEVPYGEAPLAGARLERLRSLIDNLHDEQVKGILRVEVFMGDFCLSGNPVTGYAPAADELPASRCDLIGNPFGDALTVQQRQSVAFANLVASINSNAGGVKVQLADGAHKTLAAYPAPTATLTAATWNRIAERNQRVEFTLLPAP